MLGPHDLRIGTIFVMDNDPWKVLEASFIKQAQRTGHVGAKIRNLRSGNVLTRSFKQADRFEEADITKSPATFIYAHRAAYVFSNAQDPRERFELNETQLGDQAKYLAKNLSVETLRFEGKIIGINLPPKVDMNVSEAAPWVRGDTASGGTKNVVTETGLVVKTPHFIEIGDTIRVNTQTGTYAERVTTKLD